MTDQARIKRGRGWVLAALLVAAGALGAREEPLRPQFKYVAGTEKLIPDCEGSLETTSEGLTFKCPGGMITAPYSSIRLMEYRSDVSRRVLKMKLPWKIRPDFVTPLLGAKRNRFFTVVFRPDGKTRVMVLQVPPRAMRPYLAEIDLRAGKRVEVESYEDY